MYEVLFKVTDKRISGIHLTLMASLTNQTSMVHKFYVFRVVDKFDIFWPQAILTLIAGSVLIFMQDYIKVMDDQDVKEWHVSDEVLLGIGKDITQPKAKVEDDAKESKKEK